MLITEQLECPLWISVPVESIVLHIYQFPLDILSPALVHALYLEEKEPTISVKTDLLE